MPVGQVCTSMTTVVIGHCYCFFIIILLITFASVHTDTSCAVQLTGTLPAFMSTITSLVEMELESNKVYPAAMLPPRM